MNQYRAELAAQFLRDLLEENTRRDCMGNERQSTYDVSTNRPRDDLRLDIEALITAGVYAFKGKQA